VDYAEFSGEICLLNNIFRLIREQREVYIFEISVTYLLIHLLTYLREIKPLKLYTAVDCLLLGT
jgi:hypothetical protein